MAEEDLLVLQETRRKVTRDRTIECVSGFYDFFVMFWDTVSNDELILNWHIKYLCDELEKIGIRMINREKGIEDVIINIPPGMTKSTILSLFAVWLWLHAPHFKFIGSSYASGIAIDNSIRSKTVVKSEKFQIMFQPYFVRRFGKPFILVKDNENDWRNNYGGLYYATSTNGTVTGKHAHCIFRDDPINPEQAESKAYRDRCNRFNDRTLPSRKVDKDRTPTITIMQRLHAEDTTGHELAKAHKNIRHICLPGEITDDVKPVELKERYVNGVLDPYRLSHATLETMRTDLGGYGYAGQVLQRPSKIGGNIFKENWFGRYSGMDFLRQQELSGIRAIWQFVADTAYEKQEQDDPSAFLAFTYWKNNLYIRDVARVYMEMPELIKFAHEFVMRNGYTDTSVLKVEPKASGKSLIQMLKAQTKLNVQEGANPIVDKIARANYCVPFAESGRVFLLDGAAWIDMFTDEVCVFPNAAHDDIVDCFTMSVIGGQKKGMKLSDLSGMLP